MALLDTHADVRVADPADRRRLFASGRLRGAGTDARRSWQFSYVRRIVVADLLCALAAALIGYVVRFGPATLAEGHVPFWVVVVLPLAWVLAMLVSRSYEQRFLWIGSEEFRRVFFAAMLMLAAVGTVSWAFKLDLARGFIVAALPLATVATLLTRYLIRSRLHRARGWGL